MEKEQEKEEVVRRASVGCKVGRGREQKEKKKRKR